MLCAAAEYLCEHCKNRKKAAERTGGLFQRRGNKTVKRPAKDILFTLLRIVPLLFCIALFVAYLLTEQDITAQSITDYAPANPWLAAAFLLLLYAVKSLSIVFPLIVLNIAGGFLFPPATAILVNVLGVLIELTIPYWVGRGSRRSTAGRLTRKYPKLLDAVSFQQGNALFLSFFLRIISCLPGDAVSMYLGAIRLPFSKYLLGSFLGTLPGTITATLIGTSVDDPSSPIFWISVVLTVTIAAVSFLAYFFVKRKKKQEKRPDTDA